MLTRKTRAKKEKIYGKSKGKEQSSVLPLQDDSDQSNELLHQTGIVYQIHDAVIVIDPDGNVARWNKGAEHLFGYVEAEVLGTHISFIYPEFNFNHLESKQAIVQKKVIDIVKQRNFYNLKTTAKTISGDVVSIQSSLCLLKNNADEIIGIISYSIDITELKNKERDLFLTNRALRVLSQCNQKLIQASDEEELLNDICQIIINSGGYKLAWVGYAQQDKRKTIKPVAEAGYDDGYIESLNLTWAENQPDNILSSTAIRTLKPYISQNTLTEPNYTSYMEEALKRGYNAAVAFPLIIENIAIGAISIYASEPYAFNKEEFQLLGKLVTNLAFGIQTLRTQAKRRNTDRSLREYSKALTHLTRSKELAQSNFYEFIKLLTQTSAELLIVEKVSVWLYSEDRLQLRCIEVYNYSNKTHSEGDYLECNKYPHYFSAITRDRVIAADDAHNDKATHEFSENYLTSFGITSKMDAPIWVEGLVIGIICHEHTGPMRKWSLEEQDFAGSVADFASVVYAAEKRIKAEQALLKQTQSTILLQKITAAANEATSVNQALQVCIDEVCQYADWPVGHVYILDEEDTNKLISTKLWHIKQEDKFNNFREITEKTSFASSDGLPGRVFASKKPAWIVDVDTDPDFARAKLSDDLGVATGFAFPILAGNEVAAVLEFYSSTASAPDNEMLDLMASVGTQLGRVIERQHAEKSLRQHAEIMEQINDVLITTDTLGNITTWNKGAERQLGYTTKEIFGENIDFIAHQQTKKVHASKTVNILIERGKFEYEDILRKKSGDKIPVHTSISLITDPDNAIVGIVYYSIDISQRKQAEAILERAKVIDHIHDAVIGTDLNGNINLWNKGAELQFGYTNEEIIGKSIYILHSDDKHSYSSQDVIDLLTDEHQVEYETEMKRRSGEIFHVHSSLYALTDEKGNIVGIITYSINISRRRSVEKQLDKTNRALMVLSQCNHAIAHASDEKTLLDEVCNIIVESDNYKLAWVGYAEHDKNKTVRPVTSADYQKGYLDTINISWADTKYGRGPMGTAIRTGKYSLIKDASTDPRFEPWRSAASKRGYSSIIAFPLIVGNDTYGGLIIYAGEKNAFNYEEIELLTKLSKSLTSGIQTLKNNEKRKQAEQELLKSQKQLKTFVYSLPAPIVMLDKEMRCLVYSKDWVTKFKLDEKINYSGRSYYEILPEIPEQWKKDHQRALTGKVVIIKDEAFPRKDGSLDWVTREYHPWYDTDGKTGGVIAYTELTTERKRAEEELHRNQEILHTFVKYNPAPVAMFDKDMRYLAHSKRWISEFRLTNENIIGLTHYDVFPDLPKSWRQIHLSVLAGTIEKLDDESFPRADGSLDWVRRELHPWYDSDGNVGGIIMFCELTTERRKVEEELANYRNRLEELVIERTKELEIAKIHLLNTNRTLQVLSQGNQALVHATGEQQLLDDICRIIVETGNFKMAWVGYTEHDERKTVRAVSYWGDEEGYTKTVTISWGENTEFGFGPVGTAIRTGIPYVSRDIHTDPEYAQWRDETIKRGYTSSAAIPLIKDGETYGAIMIYAQETDAFGKEEMDLLTELANNMTYGILALRKEQELIQKERLAILGQLTATVSHELRNPLGTIRSSLYLIDNLSREKGIDLDKIIIRAERNVSRCDNIINELLDYTRIRQLSLQVTNIDEWITETLDEYLFPENISISRELNANINISIERERLSRCLINIINNACQAMETSDNTSKAIEQKLTILTCIVGEKLEIRVIDTGHGLSEFNKQRIFEPLFSTKIYGIGLGLSIVKQIMLQHKGDIDIISTEGKGTTAILSLPLDLDVSTKERGSVYETDTHLNR